MESNEWKEYRFSELVEIIGGGTPKTNVEKYWNGDIPWLSVKDFNSDNRKIYYTEKTITKEGLKNSSTNLLEEGDLIISARGTVGALAQLGRPMAFNQSCYGLKAKKITSNDFIYYLLKYKIREIKQNIHGSVFDTITRNTFDVLTAKIPNIKEQKAIANILSTLDEKIETNNKINKKLEEMAQALFKHWFVDFEFPNENGKPYKSSGGEMVESELGMIPKGWEICQLDDLVDIIDNRGKTPPLSQNKTNYPIIDVKALTGTDRIVNYDNCSKFVDKNTYETWFRSGHPKTGDILLSTVGSIGELKLFFGDKGCIAQNVVALRTKNISYLYLFQYMRHIKKQLISYNIGSVQPSIKITHVKKHKILVPKKDIEDSFTEIIKNISFLIFNNSIENQRLVSIRDNLLPKLMSGEIRIPMEDGVLSEQN